MSFRAHVPARLAPDLGRVTERLCEVIVEEVLPHFGRLTAAQVIRKPTEEDPNDLVTAIDHAVERRLGQALGGLCPDAAIVGEEGCHADPSRLRALEDPERWVWLIDPIDGTKSFAAGGDAFGVMVALVRGGRTRAAWIALPARGQLFLAEEGSGAYLDGERIQVPDRPAPARPHGTVYTGFMPGPLRQRVEGWGDARHFTCPPAGCAALEYTAVLQGQKDFTVYHRLLPWDHAPGALILSEAGGRVDHLDGQTYAPTHPSQVTVLAARADVSGLVRGWFLQA